jgi:hypothetical protein
VVYNITREDIEKIIEQDPFYKNQIADYEITEIIPRKYSKQFEFFAGEENQQC